MNPNTMPLEAETRVLIDRSLENLGWKLSGKDQNVYYEQPRSEAEKKKLCGKRPDYAVANMMDMIIPKMSLLSK